MANPDDLLLAFGERIRNLREQRKLTQERLGELARLDRTYVSGIERGIRNPSLRNIGRIAAALDVPLRRLFHNL